MPSEKSGWDTIGLLQDALKASLTGAQDLRRHLSVAEVTVDTIISRGSVEDDGDRLTETGSILFLRCVIQPYAVKTLKAKTEICGPLARCLLWFVRGITEQMADTVWSIILRNKQYIDDKCSVDEVLKKPKRTPKLDVESAETRISILVELLKIDHLVAEDIDAILGLLRQSIGYLNSRRQSEAGSSGSSGTVDEVREAHFALISAKPLLARFFAPVLRKNGSLCSVRDHCHNAPDH